MGWEFGTRGNRSSDNVTNSLVKRGVYRIPDVYEDEEKDRIKGSTVAYSFWSAVKYTFLLSLLLWWLPIFGQMIAGYVGGRRAGSPNKAMLAALVPVVCIFALMGAMDAGYIPSIIGGFDVGSGSSMDYLADRIPLIAPYLLFVVDYISSFLGALQTTTSLALDSYILTIAFAYVGGIMSDQARRELQYVSEHGAPKTTVVVESPQAQPQWQSRVTQPRPSAQAMSFEAMHPLNGDARQGGEMPVNPSISMVPESEFVPHRTRRDDTFPLDGIDPSLMKDNAQRMMRDQRSIEKRAKRSKGSRLDGIMRRSHSEPSQARPAETEHQGDGWEFI